jgi:hypothetical protein
MAIPINKYNWGQWRVFNTTTEKFYGGEATMTCQDIAPGQINTRIFKVTDERGKLATGTVDVSLTSAQSTDTKIGYGNTSGGDVTDGASLAEGIVNWLIKVREEGNCGIHATREGAVITLQQESDGIAGNGDLIDAAQTLVTDGGVVVDSQFTGGQNLVVDHYNNIYLKDDVAAGPLTDVKLSKYTGVQDEAGIPIYEHSALQGSVQIEDSGTKVNEYLNFSTSSSVVWKDGGWEVEAAATDSLGVKKTARLGKGILYSNLHNRNGLNSPEFCDIIGGSGTIFQATMEGAPYNEQMADIKSVTVKDKDGGTFSNGEDITSHCSKTNSAAGMCAIDTVGGLGNNGSVHIYYTVAYSPTTKPSVKGRDEDWGGANLPPAPL